MTAAARLVALYPAPVREVWADELADATAAAGPSAWPNIVTGAADMWLHPQLWPAAAAVQRRLRLTVLVLAIGLGGWLVMLRLGEPGVDVSHGGSRLVFLGSGLALAVGLVVSAPRARLEVDSLLGLLRLVIRRLALPVGLTATIPFLAHSRVAAHPTELMGMVLTAYLWTVLVALCLQACRVVASCREYVVPPSPRRQAFGTGLAALGLGGVAVLCLAHLAANQATSGALVEGLMLMPLAGLLAHLASACVADSAHA
ncbi:MAG: hypothetical protein M3130_00300 [Actinomycetota bacterium]|nr:hypothetical protein [Actinomycetota bacterium]